MLALPDNSQPVKPWLNNNNYCPQPFSNDFNYSQSMPIYPNNRMGYPGWNPLQGLQEGSQQLTNTLSTTMATVSNFVQLVDTAVYSAWSSLTSLLALISHLSSFHNQYIRGGLEGVRSLISKIVRSLFSYSASASIDGRRVITIILAACLALAYLVKKAIGEITSLENSQLPHDHTIVTATHPFLPQSSKQISLALGQKIRISDADIDCIGRLVWITGWSDDGKCGFFPANYASLSQ